MKLFLKVFVLLFENLETFFSKRTLLKYQNHVQVYFSIYVISKLHLNHQSPEEIVSKSLKNFIYIKVQGEFYDTKHQNQEFVIYKNFLLKFFQVFSKKTLFFLKTVFFEKKNKPLKPKQTIPIILLLQHQYQSESP